MIFPIQLPLTERDDKAATVIIAVVYGGPMAQEGARFCSYISSLLFPSLSCALSRSLLLTLPRRVFILPLLVVDSLLFPERAESRSQRENIFAVARIVPEATSS